MLKTTLLILFLLFGLKTFSQWTDITPSYSTNGTAIEFVSGNVGFSSGARISKTIDGGNTWTKYVSGDPLFDNYSGMLNIKFISSTEGYAVGFHALNDDELIFHTTDAGSTWQMVFESTDDHFSALVDNLADIDIDGNRIFAVGGNEGGEIDYSLNNGITWDTIQVPNDYGLSNVLLEPSSNIVLFGGEEGIYYSNDNCNSYVQVSTYACFDMEFINDSTIISVGYSSVQLSTDHGLTWNNINYGGSHLYNVEVLNEDTIFVAGIGEVYRTTNQGYSWELMTSLTKPTISFSDFQVVNGQTAYISGRNPLDVNDYFLGKTTTGFGDGEPMISFSNSITHCPDQPIEFMNYGDTTYSYTWYIDNFPVSNNYNFDTIFGPNETHTIALEAYNGALTNQTNGIIQTSGGIDLSSHTTSFGYNGDTLCVQLSLSFNVYNSVSGATYRLLLDSNQLGNSVIGNGSGFNFVTNTNWVPTGDLYFIIECLKSNQCDTAVRLDSFYVHIAPPIIPITLSVESDSICEGGEIIFTIDTTQVNANYTLQFSCGGQYGPIQTYIGTGNSITDTISSDLFSNSCSSLYLSVEIGDYYCPIPSSVSTSNNALVQLQTIQNQVNVPNVSYVNDTIDINNYSDSSYVINWDFGSSANQQYSSQFDPSSISYPTSGIKPIHFTITNYLGCDITDTAYITVLQKMNETPINLCSYNDIGEVILYAGYDPSVYENMVISDEGKAYQIVGNTILTLDSLNIYTPIVDFSSYLYPSEYKVYTSIDVVENDLLISGHTNKSSVNIGGQYFYNGVDKPGFLVCLDSEDSIKWVITSGELSSSGSQGYIMDVKVDPYDNIFFTAIGDMYFPDGSEIINQGLTLVKVDRDGSLLSYYGLSSFGSVSAGLYYYGSSPTRTKRLSPNINFDCEGNVFVAYLSWGNAKFNIAKFSSLLVPVYTKEIASSTSDFYNRTDISIETIGSEVIAGINVYSNNDSDTLFIQGDTITFNNQACVLFNLNDTLGVNWTHRIENYNVIDLLVFDSSVLSFGTFDDYANFDDSAYSGIHSSNSDQDLLFVELDLFNGEVTSAQSFGSKKYSNENGRGGIEIAGSMAMNDSGKIMVSFVADTIIIDSQVLANQETHLFICEISLNSNCNNYNMSSVNCTTPTNILFETSSNDSLCILDPINLYLLNPVNDTASISLLYNNGLNSVVIDSNITSLNYTSIFTVPDTINGQNIAFVINSNITSDTSNFIYIYPNNFLISPQVVDMCVGDTVTILTTGGTTWWYNMNWTYADDFGDSLSYYADPINSPSSNLYVKIFDSYCEIEYPIDINIRRSAYNIPYEMVKCEDITGTFSVGLYGEPIDSIFLNGSYFSGNQVSYSGNVDTVFSFYGVNIYGCEIIDETPVIMAPNNIFFSTQSFTTCINSNPVSINAGVTIGPAGVLSGNGINGTSFDPSLAGLGVHEITYTATDFGNCTHTKSIFITVDECLSVLTNDDLKNNIKVYPNPIINDLKILISDETTLDKEDLIVIKSSLGSTLLEQKITSHALTIDLSNYPPGVYFVELLNTVTKVIKE